MYLVTFPFCPELEGIIIFLYTVQLALQTFRCRLDVLCQFASQPRCYACLLYVEDLCPRGQGATISCRWWLFCLGCHPRRQGDRGQDSGSQDSKICYTAQRTSVWWSRAEWAVVLVKNKRDPFILYPSFHYHTTRLRVSRRWPMMASDVVSIWQGWRPSWCPCRSEAVRQRGRRVCF